VLRLGDDERRTDANDSCGLAQDHLDPPCVFLAGNLARTLGGLNVGKPDDPPLGLRDNLLRNHDDVPVLELDRACDQHRQIVTLADLR
jgi:hypothetical protein